jgi:hypothetical protein
MVVAESEKGFFNKGDNAQQETNIIRLQARGLFTELFIILTMRINPVKTFMRVYHI